MLHQPRGILGRFLLEFLEAHMGAAVGLVGDGAEDYEGQVVGMADLGDGGAFGLLKFMEEKVSKDYALINETADQYRGDAEYLRGFAQKSNTTSKELADSVETMGNAMEEIAKATHEGAVGNTTVAEKVTLVAQKANDILDKINISQQGAENLKQQVAKFKV